MNLKVSDVGLRKNDGQNICLVVEDNFFAGDIMVTFLNQKGIGVDVAGNGEAAVEMYLADSARYAIIFMDLQMPGMNGYEATELIRKSGCKGADRIPIIAMSGGPLNGLGKCGFSDILRKPFKMQELLPFFAE